MHASWMLCAGRRLTTRDGDDVEVVYPGIPAGNFGPDYRDAVVAFGGGRIRVTGDVELHLCGDDWRRHGHDADAAYDRVILHVVAVERAKSARCVAGGRDVPEVVLDGPAAHDGASFLPCAHGSRVDPVSVRRRLERCGRARMLIRAATIAEQSIRAAPWESLALGVARALGYAANADASMELGRRLIVIQAERWLSPDDVGYREAVATGMAGLLPSQRSRGRLNPCEQAPEWEACWDSVESGLTPMEGSRWRMSGLYPNNSPLRRIVALADLWPVLRRLADRTPILPAGPGVHPRRSASLLEGLFRVSGSGYWRSHCDFGLSTRASDLVGASKAREIVINALLPWVAATALTEGDSQLLDAAVQLLSGYPAASPNAVTRHMRRQLRLGCRETNAAEQQGMLHLFREYCRQGRCDACPLGGSWRDSRSDSPATFRTAVGTASIDAPTPMTFG